MTTVKISKQTEKLLEVLASSLKWAHGREFTAEDVVEALVAQKAKSVHEAVLALFTDEGSP